MSKEKELELKLDSEQMSKEAQEYIDLFKERMKKVADEVLGEVYCNLMPHIESDSWTNYRNYIRFGFSKEWTGDAWRREYHTDLRNQIFNEHKEELIPLLNQDLLERIESLEMQLKHAYDRRY